MAFDATVLTGVVAELDGLLAGGRINKIYQPFPHELAVLVHTPGQTHRVLLSCHPEDARLHLTRLQRPNPPHPPTFCMLLRKHLEGGRLTAVRQQGRDRIAHLLVMSRDELGNPVTYTLVAELMGRRANLVLVGPDGRIIDAARRAGAEANPYREVLPGVPYVPPPATAKLDPAVVQAADLAAALARQPARRPLWQRLLDCVDGIGPLLARELAHRAGVAATDADAPAPPGGEGAADAAAPLAAVVRDLAAAVRDLAATTAAGRWEPRLLYGPDGGLRDVSAVALEHWSGHQEPFPSLSAALDHYYAQREAERQAAQLRATLQRTLAMALGRARRKAAAQGEELAAAENADDLRIRGEMLMAHLWQVPRGAATVALPNLYAPDSPPLAIALDPALSPTENAQAYFRRYQRARAGRRVIQAQLTATAAEVAYLEQVATMLAAAVSLPDLAEIQRELAREGYLAGRSRNRRGESRGGGGREDARAAGGRAAAEPSRPLVVHSSDGLEIWVGRNNRQNDHLTLKLARPHDLWLHTQKIPGAHVILRLPPGTEPPPRSLEEAAALAAYYSQARQSANVPVDYTLCKFVKKPGGARPGMVIYERQQTLYVTPDPARYALLGRSAQERPAHGR